MDISREPSAPAECLRLSLIHIYKDSKYNCMQDLIDDAKANPGRVTVAITGAGSVPAVWFSLLSKHFDVQFNIVQYEGNGDAMTALMGGHVDAFITNTQQSLSYVESGDIKPITLLFDNEIPQLKGTEKLSEAYPELAQYSGCLLYTSPRTGCHKDAVPYRNGTALPEPWLWI